MYRPFDFFRKSFLLCGVPQVLSILQRSLVPLFRVICLYPEFSLSLVPSDPPLYFRELLISFCTNSAFCLGFSFCGIEKTLHLRGCHFNQPCFYNPLLNLLIVVSKNFPGFCVFIIVHYLPLISTLPSS